MSLTEGEPPIPPRGSSGLSDAFIDFLERAVVRDPAARLTAEQLLDMPWFEEQGIDSVADARAQVVAWLRTLPPPRRSLSTASYSLSAAASSIAQ